MMFYWIFYEDGRLELMETVAGHSEQSLKYRRSRLFVWCVAMIADAGTAHTGRRTHFSRKALRIQWQSRNVTD